MRTVGTAAVCLLACLVLLGCEGQGYGPGESEEEQAIERDNIDASPTKQDGSSSYEFEEKDIVDAEGASQEIQDYCAGAVSEAQEVGCLSHVDESDIP